ncbi:thiol S-methyltransferase TMT1A-like [Oratosquilla oratoria]|uniref:thiol S-methyltransferase TMT1A-like n=1 Tax=Oratosquilla oratoria TaxID=337810 RepID=UPI003F76A07C
MDKISWKDSKELQLGVALIIGGIIILYLKGRNIKQRLFAALISYVVKKDSPGLEKLKDKLLEPISELVSHIPDLKEKKAVKILEIGVGTGTNFKYYPNGSHLVVVDPNPFFAKYYDENRKNFPNITSEDILVMKGEDMDCIADESIDVVVVTHVLCSASDLTKMLQQICRVLVPNGKLFFMEHIREWDEKEHGLRQMLQDFLTFTRIWPFFFEGCITNNDPVPVMHEVGFTSVSCKSLYAPMPNFIFEICSPHAFGVAVK